MLGQDLSQHDAVMEVLPDTVVVPLHWYCEEAQGKPQLDPISQHTGEKESSIMQYLSLEQQRPTVRSPVPLMSRPAFR